MKFWLITLENKFPEIAGRYLPNLTHRYLCSMQMLYYTIHKYTIISRKLHWCMWLKFKQKTRPNKQTIDFRRKTGNTPKAQKIKNNRKLTTYNFYNINMVTNLCIIVIMEIHESHIEHYRNPCTFNNLKCNILRFMCLMLIYVHRMQ